MEYPTPVTPSLPYFTHTNADQSRSTQGQYPYVPSDHQGGSYHHPPSPHIDPHLGQYSPSYSAHQVPLDGPYQPPNYPPPNTPQYIPIDPALRNFSAPTAPMAPMYSSPKIRNPHRPIQVAGLTLQFHHQRFIVYAMSFLGYSAQEVSLVFGLHDSGTGSTRISAAQIQAAHEYLESGRAHNPSNAGSELWERDDDSYEGQIRVKIDMARRTLYELRMKQMEDEEAEKWTQVRRNLRVMDGVWKDEQDFFRELMLKAL